MRGGTSKGGIFNAADLPTDENTRDQLLLEIMGSPDHRQIDGMGGSDPLTSKVGVVKKSSRPDCDIDYLFLQVFVDQAIVTDAQNCLNLRVSRKCWMEELKHYIPKYTLAYFMIGKIKNIKMKCLNKTFQLLI